MDNRTAAFLVEHQLGHCFHAPLPLAGDLGAGAYAPGSSRFLVGGRVPCAMPCCTPPPPAPPLALPPPTHTHTASTPQAASWKRVEVMQQVLALGYSVILSDLDTVWLRNPGAYLAGAAAGADLVLASDAPTTSAAPGGWRRRRETLWGPCRGRGGEYGCSSTSRPPFLTPPPPRCAPCPQATAACWSRSPS